MARGCLLSKQKSLAERTLRIIGVFISWRDWDRGVEWNNEVAQNQPEKSTNVLLKIGIVLNGKYVV